MTNLTIWTKSYWLSVLERLIRGAAIGALLYLGIGEVIVQQQLNVLEIDWLQFLGYTLGGALLALLFSIAGNAYSKNGPSFIKTEQVTPPLPNEPES